MDSSSDFLCSSTLLRATISLTCFINTADSKGTEEGRGDIQDSYKRNEVERVDKYMKN